VMGPMSPPSGGGDLSWASVVLIAVVILIGLAVVALSIWRQKRADRLADKTRIERTRAAVREQLDAVANDILKLEDEVQAAGNGDALAYYRNATITYAVLVDDFETSDNSQELTNLAARLDAAIWQLDATEAILDGDPLPPKPLAVRRERETARQDHGRLSPLENLDGLRVPRFCTVHIERTPDRFSLLHQLVRLACGAGGFVGSDRLTL